MLRKKNQKQIEICGYDERWNSWQEKLKNEQILSRVKETQKVIDVTETGLVIVREVHVY